MLTIQPRQPCHVEGFAPSEAPTLERVDDIVQIGQIFRGTVYDLTYLDDGTLLVATCSGVDVIDPDGNERPERWLAGEHIRQVERMGDRLIVSRYHPEDNSLTLHTVSLGDALGEPLLRLEGVGERRRFGVHDSGLVAVPGRSGPSLHRLTEVGLELVFAHEFEEVGPWLGAAQISPNGVLMAANYADRGGVWRISDGSYVETEWDGETGWSTYWGKMKGFTFLPDNRLIGWDVFPSQEIIDPSGESPRRRPNVNSERHYFVGGGRVLACDGLGAYQVLSMPDFEVEIDGGVTPYGGHTFGLVGAIMEDRFALYVPGSGELRCYGAKEFVKHGYRLVRSASVSQDGKRFAFFAENSNFGVAKNELLLVDRDAHTCLRASGVDRNEIDDVGLTRNGETAYLGMSLDSRAKFVCSMGFDGSEPQSWAKMQRWIEGFLFLQDELFAVCTYTHDDCRDGFVGIYQHGTKRVKRKLTAPGAAEPLDFCVSPACDRLAICTESHLTLFDLTAKGCEPVEIIDANAETAAFSVDGSLAWVEKTSPLTLHLRAPDGAERAIELPRLATRGVRRDRDVRLAFSDDGSLLFAAHSIGLLEMRDPSDGTILRTLNSHSDGIFALKTTAGLLWVLGGDGALHAFGSPSVAAVREES